MSTSRWIVGPELSLERPAEDQFADREVRSKSLPTKRQNNETSPADFQWLDATLVELALDCYHYIALCTLVIVIEQVTRLREPL